ncbi:MAG: plasmid pRiA4b ORF-3 family protein [Pseudomonadota bacterium]
MPSQSNPKPTFASFNEIATIRIELEESDPLIWREIETPTLMTLKMLHDVIQKLMGWSDDHLWKFNDKICCYSLFMEDDWDDTPCRDAANVRLRDICERKKTVLTYVYDFGDNWRMRVVISNIRQGDPELDYPRYLGGERAGPPEDSGGIPGFYNMLEARPDPKHPDHDDANEFLLDYDPDKIDEVAINSALSRIAKRLNAVRKRLLSAEQNT